ncbi:glycosyltransferase [Candidatus Pacearchaeota archaeon]|nr:glycosyltransferase [Candidatus Pacearchaeota archaeon]
MPEALTVIYLVYMFLALYFLMLFTVLFAQNRKEIFSFPKAKNKYSVSVLIPAFNEEDSIEGTVKSVLNSDYKYIGEVIVINDGSTDNTLKIVRELEKKYSKVKVLDKVNEGNKGAALNYAIPYVKGDLIAVVDADSYPDKNALSTMTGYFDDKDVGVVTTSILVRDRNNFLRKMQAIEYKVIAFTRKLLDFVDSIYVTPGPLALYNKKILKKIGGFDTKNLTEDIEATWHMLHDGYKVRMSFISKSTTVAPNTIKKWIKQRIRWTIGGIQCIIKYKNVLFRKGMLGYFIIPFFAFSLVLGVFGLGIFFYRILRGFLSYYLTTNYSLASQTAIIVLQDINLNPSILNFLGIILFLLGVGFTYFSISFINSHIKEKENFFSVVFYLLVYILLTPLVLIVAVYKLSRKKYSW